MAGDVLHPLQIGGGDRLLHKLDVEALVLHLVQDADGLLGVPGLVGVNADADVLAHGLADGGQTGHIQLRVNADLDFQAIVAASRAISSGALTLMVMSVTMFFRAPPSIR